MAKEVINVSEIAIQLLTYESDHNDKVGTKNLNR